MFRNKYHKIDKEISTNPGSPIKTIYEAKYDKDKNLQVVEKGTEDLFHFINSFKNSADINIIVKKFMNGDKEQLLQRAGAYADISNVPKSFQAMVDSYLAGQNLYATLPYQIKEKFNNNAELFISKMNTEEWKKIMDTSQDEIMQQEVKGAAKVEKQLKDVVKHAPKPIENPAVDAPVTEGGDVQ